MAGNIIPAIATTNAVIAGLIVLQALHLLRKSYDKLRNVHIQYKPAVPLSTISLSKPNLGCGVCRDTYVLVMCDPARARLGDVVRGVLGGDEREVSVYEDKRVLSDPDWDDNWERTLESLNVTRGKFLTVVDEEGEWNTLSVGLGVLPPNHPIDGPAFILPSPLPEPSKKPQVVPPPPETPPKVSLKRGLDDGEIIDLAPTPKRPRVSALDSNPDVSASPSKRRRLEEEGLIIMDRVDDKLVDDVIVID